MLRPTHNWFGQTTLSLDQRRPEGERINARSLSAFATVLGSFDTARTSGSLKGKSGIKVLENGIKDIRSGFAKSSVALSDMESNNTSKLVLILRETAEAMIEGKKILHERQKGRLVNTLDNERWVQCDVSPERQTEIDRLVSSGEKTVTAEGSLT